jgi:hypothetical protein
MQTPHGIHVDREGNVWIADFAGNEAGTKGHQVHKFSTKGEKLMSLGIAGKPGNADGQFNQPNDVAVGPDGSIYVADGHEGQGMITSSAIAEGLAQGATARISKFTADGTFVKSWGKLGVRHGEFRTPHALAFDSKGRLWVADRGNHRLEIFDQDGNYLESRYMYGRISGIFFKDAMVYAIDSESGPYNHVNWRNGVRIGPLDEDRITAFIPPFERDDRVYQGTAGEGVAVDADGNCLSGRRHERREATHLTSPGNRLGCAGDRRHAGLGCPGPGDALRRARGAAADRLGDPAHVHPDAAHQLAGTIADRAHPVGPGGRYARLRGLGRHRLDGDRRAHRSGAGRPQVSRNAHRKNPQPPGGPGGWRVVCRSGRDGHRDWCGTGRRTRG